MEPSKWQKRIAAGELSFDLERKAFMDAAIRAENCSTWKEVMDFFEKQFKKNLPGGDRPLSTCADPFMKPLPGEKIVNGLYRVSEYATKKFAEDKSLDRDCDTMSGWRCWAGVTATAVQTAALFHPDTRLFLVDAEMARDVVNSRNDRVSGCDVERAPFPLTWVDLSEPVKFAIAPSGLNVGMKAISMVCVPGTDLQVVSILTDYKIPDLPIHATMYMLFAKESCICVGMENELQIACDLTSPTSSDPQSGKDYSDIFDRLSVCVKNLIDFLTSRSFSYVDCRRDHIDLSKIKKYRHVQGLLSSVRRDYKLVVMSKDIPRNPPPGRREEFEPGYSVDIPGCFHRWVYCGTCGDCHRHDLIGRPCRKCGLVVGPQLNIRIERYWHPPYVWGSGPRKEYARHLLP